MRTRLFARMSVQLAANQFTSATFLLDTGCCVHLNVCRELKQLMASRLTCSDLGPQYLTMSVQGQRSQCTVVSAEEDSIMSSSAHHQQQTVAANVMGLPMLLLLGIRFQQQSIGALKCDDLGIVRDAVTMHAAIKYI